MLVLCASLTAPGSAPGEIAANAVTIHGERVSGALLAIDESGIVLGAEPTARHIMLSDLLELNCDSPALHEVSVPSLLFLTSGDRLAVHVLYLQDDALLCHWPQSDEDSSFTVSLDAVLGLMLHTGPRGRTERSLERELQQREFQNDVLFLTNGDRLSGILDELDHNSCRCETAVGMLEVNRSRVRAVGFNAALLAPVEPADTRLVLHLNDGSWLTGTSAMWNGESDLQVASVTGARIPVPIRKLRSISCYGPNVTPLSDVRPSRIEMTPYLTRETPPQRDRNVHGGPLSVRGETFAKGQGMYPRTTATYALDGAYTAFHAVVGIDDAAKGAGSVVFAVDVDGQRLFESGLITSRDVPQQIGPIDLSQAQSMTLSVDYGIQGDIGDLADWCNPVLIRRPQAED